MATLTRTPAVSVEYPPQSEQELDTYIPQPFPIHVLQQERERSVPQVDHPPPSILLSAASQSQVAAQEEELEKSPSNLDTSFEHDSVQLDDDDVLPSLVHVQQSCLETLNNLLSRSMSDGVKWSAIVPARRHSAPPIGLFTPSAVTPESSSALHTLIANLRVRDASRTDVMVETGSNALGASSTTPDAHALCDELVQRVNVDTGLLSYRDTQLARALASLYAYSTQILQRSSLTSLLPGGPSPLALSPHLQRDLGDPSDMLGALSRQLITLQSHRAHSESRANSPSPGINHERGNPILVVEKALLWNKVDDALDSVLRLCREASGFGLVGDDNDHAPPSVNWDHYPPEYDHDKLPEYDIDSEQYDDVLAEKPAAEFASAHTSASTTRAEPTSYLSSSSEKMKLDLDAVTMAIDRLYLVAPQLHSQRVELKAKKLEELELARVMGTIERVAARGRLDNQRAADPMSGGRAKLRKDKGKAREGERDGATEDLDKLLSLISKADAGRLPGQRFEVNDANKTKGNTSKQKEGVDTFMEHILKHTSVGRLHSQDAVLSTTRSPKRMQSVKSFRQLDIGAVNVDDPEALLSLPEFMKETMSGPLPLSPGFVGDTKGKGVVAKLKGRKRSHSAPSVAAWFTRVTSSSLNSSSSSLVNSAAAVDVNAEGLGDKRAVGLAVYYVAEHQEKLNSVQVFVQVPGLESSMEGVEAEVIAAPGGDGGEESQKLVVRTSLGISAPLVLPTPVVPGPYGVRVAGNHLEIKLAALPVSEQRDALGEPSHDTPILLDAAHLSRIAPTSFICASCSSLVAALSQPPNPSRSVLRSLTPSTPLSTLAVPAIKYADLPSEHWAELIDAWMCHTDQKLSEQVQKHTAHGFWPEPDRVLVGGSYLLFAEEVIVKENLKKMEKNQDVDDRRHVHCACGTLLGHSQSPLNSTSVAYRFAKYSVRPVGHASDLIRLSFSAFVVADMIELARAHASYRFVIKDEEEEKPRILIWLFNPSIQLSYATPKGYFIPQSGLGRVAKVMYKIIGPAVSEPPQDVLSRYPGFSQAEELYYPMDNCRSLAAILKESNNAYPEARRAMNNFDVGWLCWV
ncbi:hypothetical protein BOTBODRAFT_37311 [Botryobasidium botryosum FD-172 SS1]|uniref:Uncharacterized protein n=1 Tax=Botryobasidium botryosum (strain FD-172 SS1) TaxID=930990 RepID=A0A067MB09_BOTB1|nr:hypothetical protein BOTBODRAFT_37311 [Botryobasidium botryosum FD-172 SS1]